MAIKESFHFKMDRKVAVFTKDRKSMKEELARRKLDYFGHPDDGRCTLNIDHIKLPTFLYHVEPPEEFEPEFSEEISKQNVNNQLAVKCPPNLDRFMVAPERKNVWLGGIRSQCEGVLSAKAYTSAEADRGVYTVIPEIDGADVTVEAVYKMWLALECAMIRRECLIIVEDPALAQVTNYRTEQWRLLNRYVRWGSTVSVIFATFFRRWTTLYILPFCLATYGYGMLRVMKLKDPASRYSECAVNKQYEVDPDSHIVSDAQVSMRYLRSPQYRMFKLESHSKRDKQNRKLYFFTLVWGIIAFVRNIYDLDYTHPISHRGHQPNLESTPVPLNIFQQLRKRFFTFGNNPEPGRSDMVHWIVQNALFYYFFLRRIPWMIQTCLEYTDREQRMAMSIRYLQFRNLQGEERYEFPARNLYRTMQKDFPDNRVLEELRDHYHAPPDGYYESENFLKTRKTEDVTFKQALRRWKVSYYRNW